MVPLITNQYVPIVAPIDCNYFMIIGNADGSNTPMQRSSDGTDANSYTIPAGGWYSFLAPTRRPYTRFKIGETVTFIKVTAGVGPVIVEFSD